MSKRNAGFKAWLAVAVVGALVAACGTNSRPTVTGAAQASGPVAGKVALVDASPSPQGRSAAAGADGNFAVDVSGTRPPYLLRVEGAGGAQLFAATLDGGQADVNPITTVAFWGVAGDGTAAAAFQNAGGDATRVRAVRARQVLVQLRVVLAPLFDRYGVGDPAASRAAVRRLLQDVSFQSSGGLATVTNRATGAIIFTGPLSNLSAGTVHRDAMPAGRGDDDDDDDDDDGGGGGGGGGDGAALYAANCAGCHGPLATSNVRGGSLSDIQEAIADDEGGMGFLSSLSLTQLQAIAASLNGGGGGGGGGTDGAALYAASCAGCHGPLSSSDVGGASLASIQAAIASDVGGMGSLSGLSSTQLQAIATALGSGGGGGGDGAALYAANCAGCHGPLSSSDVGGASLAGIQAAIANDVGGMGSLSGLTAMELQAITTALAGGGGGGGGTDGAALYTANCASCHGPINVSDVSGASLTSIQAAIAGDLGGMGSLSGLSSTQLQAISAALGGGGGGDGTALYTANCTLCHGSIANSDVRGESLSDIQEAIADNEGGMGFLSSLSLTQLQAIAAALNGSGGGGGDDDEDGDDDDGEGEGEGGGSHDGEGGDD